MLLGTPVQWHSVQYILTGELSINIKSKWFTVSWTKERKKQPVSLTLRFVFCTSALITSTNSFWISVLHSQDQPGNPSKEGRRNQPELLLSGESEIWKSEDTAANKGMILMHYTFLIVESGYAFMLWLIWTNIWSQYMAVYALPAVRGFGWQDVGEEHLSQLPQVEKLISAIAESHVKIRTIFLQGGLLKILWVLYCRKKSKSVVFCIF